MRSALLALGVALYAIGALGGLLVLVLVARADTALVRAEAPGAPALELARGTYDIRLPAGDGDATARPTVFALASREVITIRPASDGGAFEVEAPGVYVIELPVAGGSVHSRERFVVSPTLIFAAFVVPVAGMPGVALVDAAVAGPRRDVLLGRSPFQLASIRRRVAAQLLDLLAIGALLIVLLLLTPLLTPISPFVPLAPLAYVWAGNARGRTVGRWLGGTRVVTDGGAEPGWGIGLLRTLGWLASWCLLGAGYLAAAWRPGKVAPHDALASTRVVYD